jgi:hypothetical protein
MKSFVFFALTLSLSACASHKAAPNNNTGKEIGAAVTAPLNDLNLVKTAIPDILKSAQNDPYAPPMSNSCDALGKEISTLDEVLGADLDVPITHKDEGLVERNLVAESVSAIRKTTEAVVPFRNWVRKLSGAERKSKLVTSAITAGSIRRAYLKGIGQANKCMAPAAPKIIAGKN